jgi:hypothetical protein
MDSYRPRGSTVSFARSRASGAWRSPGRSTETVFGEYLIRRRPHSSNLRCRPLLPALLEASPGAIAAGPPPEPRHELALQLGNQKSPSFTYG